MNLSDILSFIQSASSPVTKREIARAFHIKGGEKRVALKQILKKLEKDGAIVKQPGGAYSAPDGLPEVCIIEITELDIDGDVFARAVDWNEELQGPAPRIELVPEKRGHPAPASGDRVLARLSRLEDGTYAARAIKRLDTPEGRVLGLVRLGKRGATLEPADKKARYNFEIPQAELNGAVDGDLAIGEIQPARGLQTKKVRILEVIGRQGDPRAISILSLSEAGLREEFPPAVLKETEGMKVPDLKGREDLRAIALVTIDGADARDFDDAVFAERTDGGGFHLIVAIADVAYYVRPDSALDREAVRRGNSTYFPDRVVPMLPEALSNDLCSLRPHENRACLAVHMYIDAQGKLLSHKFVRGLMRSEARLTYEQVQAARDGVPDDKTGPLMKGVIEPLYEAYHVLDAARQKRGALDLDLPERQIIINEAGHMTGVRKRLRLDAHKLIEEFMVLANVAAAQALEARRAPCVYRIHDQPKADKLDSASEFLEGFGLSLPKGQTITPAKLNHLLHKAAEMPFSHLISTVILRTQSQAHYAPENIGHYGLALSRYAHFTSPIRRYADLLVHRSLIRAYGLGPGGLDEAEEARLAEICDAISGTERTSMEAERNAIDRFTAAFLSQQVGAEFSGRISGVTRFGLFVTLDESGADGIVPMRSLSNDFYIHDERAHALIGRRSGRVFRLGAPVTVRLREADGLSGSTVLEMTGDSVNGADVPGARFRPTQGAQRDERRDHRGKRRSHKHKSRSAHPSRESDGKNRPKGQKNKGFSKKNGKPRR